MGEPDPGSLRIRVEERFGQPAVLFLRGEIDVSNVDGLRRAIEQAAARADSIVLDVADTTFIDGSVVSVLASANARIAGGLRVRRANPFVAKVFSLVELEHLLTA